MPLDERNVETVIRLLSAHQSRYGAIQEAGALLLRGHVYRSPDGQITIGSLTEADKEQLTKQIDDLLREARVIANNIEREILPQP